MPKVSVITPAYNGARFIRQMIASVRAQTLTEFEHVVVDDGSKDDTAAIVEEHCASDPRLRLIRQPNGGVAKARNAGFRASCPQSSYLLFLDADDCLHPRMLELLSRHLDEHAEAGLAFCDFVRTDEQGKQVPHKPGRRVVPSRFGARVLPVSEPRTPMESILCSAPVFESLSMIRRTAFEKTPGWCEEIGQPGEGVELFARIGLISEVHFVPEVLYEYRLHGSQSTADLAHTAAQGRRITRYLSRMNGLSPQQRRRLNSALRFQAFRYCAWDGFGVSKRHWVEGRHRLAARFFVGATWRYAISLVV